MFKFVYVLALYPEQNCFCLKSRVAVRLLPVEFVGKSLVKNHDFSPAIAVFIVLELLLC